MEIYSQQQQQQMYEMDDYLHQQQDMMYNPGYGGGSGGSRSINQDQIFMKWLFSFRKEVVEPLRYVWSGYEFNHSTSEWDRVINCEPIMNESGINWCISLIDSYINPVIVVSNYDEQFMNYTMREITKVIWNSLAKRWKEFGIRDKTDIPRIANEIESKILSILLGARGDGFRRFFAQQYRISETYNNNQQAQQNQKGIMDKMLGMFTPKQT